MPAAAEGGSDRLAPIAGRVAGARPGQQIVLFAKSAVGVWWVQPLTVQPFTAIDADSTWKNTIHLGTEYAALLVEPGFRPPATTESLPEPGGAVVAVATVKGTGEFVPRARRRGSSRSAATNGKSGRSRAIAAAPTTTIPTMRGPMPTAFLHLKLTQRDGRWTSAEVILTRPLGYGTYVFVVRDTSQLDPAAALGLLTWDDQGADQNHRELDIEISQWGDPQHPERAIRGAAVLRRRRTSSRFAAPPGRLDPLVSVGARPRVVQDRPRSGLPADDARSRSTSSRPACRSPATRRVRMNLYYFRYAPSPPQKRSRSSLRGSSTFPVARAGGVGGASRLWRSRGAVPGRSAHALDPERAMSQYIRDRWGSERASPAGRCTRSRRPPTATCGSAPRRGSCASTA